MISVFKVKKHDISQEIKKEILYTYIVYEIYLVKVCPPSLYMNKIIWLHYIHRSQLLLFALSGFKTVFTHIIWLLLQQQPIDDRFERKYALYIVYDEKIWTLVLLYCGYTECNTWFDWFFAQHFWPQWLCHSVLLLSVNPLISISWYSSIHAF